MSDKSLKPFDAAALVGEAGASTDADAEAASSQAAPEGAPEDGAAPAAQTPPAVVTRAELAAILDEQNRRWQSTLDKRTAAISRQLQAQQNAERALEAARASGVVIPPDKQAEFLKALAKQGLLTGGNGQDVERGASSVEGSAPDDGDPSTSSGLDAVTARGYAIAEEYGLSADDPEADEIKTDSPQAYFQSIRLAGQKKINRLAKAPNPARMPGLTPGGGPAKTDLSKKPRSELLKTEVRAAMKGGAR
jgi:hypothetical protein